MECSGWLSLKVEFCLIQMLVLKEILVERCDWGDIKLRMRWLTRWGELPKPIFFVDRSKAGKMIWLLISSSGILGWPSVLRFLDVVFDMTMTSLGFEERVDISSTVSSRFIKTFTTRTLATCCSVNAVLMYLMKPILASQCVLYLSCALHVLFFYKVVIMFSSPCFIDDETLVDSMTWWTKKRGKRVLRSLIMVNFDA